MPCLDISTNVNLDGVDVDSFFKEATTAVANIIGKPEKYVMIVLKGSANIHFGGNKEAAAFAEVVSMGGINSEVDEDELYWGMQKEARCRIRSSRTM